VLLRDALSAHQRPTPALPHFWSWPAAQLGCFDNVLCVAKAVTLLVSVIDACQEVQDRNVIFTFVACACWRFLQHKLHLPISGERRGLRARCETEKKYFGKHAS